MDMLDNRIIRHFVDQYDITEEEAIGLIGGDSAYSLTGRTEMRWCEVCHLRIATYEPTSADGTMHAACARRSARKALRVMGNDASTHSTPRPRAS